MGIQLARRKIKKEVVSKSRIQNASQNNQNFRVRFEITQIIAVIKTLVLPMECIYLDTHVYQIQPFQNSIYISGSYLTTKLEEPHSRTKHYTFKPRTDVLVGTV
jgi:hypothetical protein